MTDVTDIDLLQDYARQGSEQAFAELVRRHIGLVHSAALRRTGGAAQAEEITQAVFIILARKAASLRPGTVLEGWLYETTRLTAASFLRGERRRMFREQEAFMQSTLTETLDESAWTRLAPLLEEAMACLGPKDRDAVVLRFFKEKRLSEVATAMRVSEAAAQSRVTRALGKLHRFLSKRGVALTVSALASAMAANSVQAAPVALAQTVGAMAFGKAAVPASTLGLVKGTLGLMVWMRAKTAVMACTVVLLGGGAGVMMASDIFHFWRTPPPPDLQGAWEGVSQIGDPGVNREHTRTVVKVRKTEGGYAATMDAIDLGWKDIPATITYDYPKIHFVLGGWTAFDATMNSNGTEITFTGDPAVVLVRTNAPDTVPDRMEPEDYAPRRGSVLQGCWQGLFEGVVLVTWKVAESADGTFRGELDNPEIGENHKPFAVVYQPPDVTFTVLYGTGIFRGSLNAGKTAINGTWLQRGKSVPITLQRVDYQPELAPPASEFVYSAKSDLQGHWQADLDLRMARQLLRVGDLQRFPVDLDIARHPDGTYWAALNLPLMTLMGLGDFAPAETVQYQAQNLRLEWPGLNGVMGARLDNGRLRANLRFAGASVPLVFERRP
jgi:RNA polymerase sigma factor (sigma-70 family)